MTEISLQNNPIRTLSSFAFSGIRNVSNLMLGHNQLSVIEGSAFAATEMIQMLILNNNPIKTVESQAFTGLKLVKFIFLPAGVRHLRADAFSGLEMVDKLKLAYLDLSELAPFTFRGIKRLRSLTIENSDLATIRSNAFAGKWKYWYIWILAPKSIVKIVWNRFQNRASFGKSQLLNGLTLANQNKMARKFKYLIFAMFSKWDFLSWFLNIVAILHSATYLLTC